LSRERRTTAGSRLMYEFYAKSADVRVKEVNVANGGAGVVKVCYHADEDITETIKNYLNADEIRPLTDKVEVEKAEVKEVLIDAVLIAKDISLVNLEVIKARFSDFEEKFNVFLSVPKIYDLLTDENIVDVDLKNPLSGVKTEFNEVLKFRFNLGVDSVS
ncbi:MAG: baseplate J/gp47 family protein, partial [Nautiliaceae bacterium]